MRTFISYFRVLKQTKYNLQIALYWHPVHDWKLIRRKNLHLLNGQNCEIVYNNFY